MRNDLNVFFSIIIPVYNVEDYVKTCVESVLRQEFKDFELILVDDGSTDQSGAMCDMLAQEDARIRVIHQQNQGLSGARNTGLREACGKYILFLDSDDFYPQNDFLKIIREKSEERDVVCFNYARYTDRQLQPMLDFPETGGLEPDAYLLEMVKRNAYSSSACIKAVKRSLLLENDITFELATLSEDIEWSAKVMRAAGGVAVAPDCIYAYRVRQGSITKTVSQKHVDMQYRIINKLIAAPAEGSKAFCDAYNGYIAFQYSALLINARLCKPRLDREKLRKIKEMSWLLQYDANRIVKLIHTVYNLLGFEITSWLLLIYFKLFCK